MEEREGNGGKRGEMEERKGVEEREGNGGKRGGMEVRGERRREEMDVKKRKE